MNIFGIFWIIKFFIIFGNFAATNGASLRCYDGSFDVYTEYSLDNPTPYLNSSFYQPGLKIVVYTFGFNGKVTGPAVQRMIRVYIGRVNICLLNWQKEASTGILGPLGYPMVIMNAKKVGQKFGRALIELFKAGVNPSEVHLIGHSLGAQVYGYAGREVKENSVYVVNWITGLDPAGPGYDGILSLTGLRASDAIFVVVIHTNPGAYGSDETAGTVDIWPNCGKRIQPGCEGTNLITFLDQDLCSHDRAWEYYAESVEDPTAFEARAAASCDDWRAGRGGNETIYIGDEINMAARGEFYLRTNSTPPFGLGMAGSQPDSQ